jgi:hypothetical protein
VKNTVVFVEGVRHENKPWQVYNSFVFVAYISGFCNIYVELLKARLKRKNNLGARQQRHLFSSTSE